MERYFPCYLKDWDAVKEAVTPQQGWALFLRCLDYVAGRELQPVDDPVVIALFSLLSGGIDRSLVKAEKTAAKRRYSRYCGVCKECGDEALSFDEWLVQIDECQHSSANVNTRQHSSTCIDNHNHKSKSESESESNYILSGKPQYTHFVPPTVEEVASYCRERKSGIDPEQFVDFYTARNWYLSKGLKMKDWKAAVRTWERNSTTPTEPQSQPDHSWRAQPSRTPADLVENPAEYGKYLPKEEVSDGY